MWMVPVEFMCIKHRNGEHFEYHKHKPRFVQHQDMTGYILSNSLEPMSMKARHDELAKTLGNHNSPFEQPDLSYMPDNIRYYVIDVQRNFDLLMNRCPDCRNLFIEATRK